MEETQSYMEGMKVRVQAQTPEGVCSVHVYKGVCVCVCQQGVRHLR